MTNMTCGECGIAYSMPDAKYADLRKTGDTFYCPNGHARHFVVGPDEKDRLIERLRDQLRDSGDKYCALVDERDEWRDRARYCVLCGFRVARANASASTMESRMREHLEQEHSARRLRPALPAAGESSG